MVLQIWLFIEVECNASSLIIMRLLLLTIALLRYIRCRILRYLVIASRLTSSYGWKWITYRECDYFRL
uniref:Putative secreted protein n=1 Tax=Anopheles darlingi TaxID=43151 RepID=A0A2M4D173_ANODA